MPVVERGGQRIGWFESPGAGEAIVLAHNLLTSADTFAAVAARLAPRLRVLAVDLRGHGASGAAPRPFTTVDLADDLAAVMDAAGVASAVVAGTSLGAAAAVELALRRPGRVRGLALMAATPHAARAQDRVKFAALAAVLRGLGPGPVLPWILADLLGASFRAADPDDVAAVADRIRAAGRRELAWAVRAWVRRPRLAGRLAAIEVPTAVVVGAEDTACPRSYSAAIAAEIRGATLHVVPGAGHTLQLEQPAAVAAILEALVSRTIAT